MSTLELKYVEKAKALGIDVENPTQMHYLVQAVRYSEARFTQVKYNRTTLADDMGVTVDSISLMRQNPYLKQGMQLVFETVMEELRSSDLKQQLLSGFKEDYMDWFNNMSRIAKGRALAEGGKKPLDRDAINAYQALMATKLNEAFLDILFVPDKADSPEAKYMESMRLQKDEDVIDLDYQVPQIRSLQSPIPTETPPASDTAPV